MFISSASLLEKLKMPLTYDHDEWKKRKIVVDSLHGFGEWLLAFAKEGDKDDAYLGHLIILFRYLSMQLSGREPKKNGSVEAAVLSFLARDRMETPDLDQSEWKPEPDLFEDENPPMLAIMPPQSAPPPMSFEDIQKPIPVREESAKTGFFEGFLDEAGSKESSPKNWAAAAAAPPKPDPVPEPAVGPVEEKITGVLAADNDGYYITTGGEDKIYLPLDLETDIPEQSVVTVTGVRDDKGHYHRVEKIERTVLTGTVTKFTDNSNRVHYKITVDDQDYRVNTLQEEGQYLKDQFGGVIKEKYGKGDKPVMVRFYAHRFLNKEGFIKTEDRGRKLLPNVSWILID